jgi:hypothetical protein
MSVIRCDIRWGNFTRESCTLELYILPENFLNTFRFKWYYNILCTSECCYNYPFLYDKFIDVCKLPAENVHHKQLYRQRESWAWSHSHLRAIKLRIIFSTPRYSEDQSSGGGLLHNFVHQGTRKINPPVAVC